MLVYVEVAMVRIESPDEPQICKDASEADSEAAEDVAEVSEYSDSHDVFRSIVAAIKESIRGKRSNM